MLLKFRTSVGRNRPDCLQDGTETCTDTHTLEKHRSWLPQRDYLEIRLLLHHGCHNVKDSEEGVINTQHWTAQQKQRSWNSTALCVRSSYCASCEADYYRIAIRNRIFQHFGRLSSGLRKMLSLAVSMSYWSIFEGNLVGLVDFTGSKFQRMAQFRFFDRNWASWSSVGIRACKMGQSH